jgi:hypothetical protein
VWGTSPEKSYGVVLLSSQQCTCTIVHTNERTNERTHSDRSRDAVDLSFSKAKKKSKNDWHDENKHACCAACIVCTFHLDPRRVTGEATDMPACSRYFVYLPNKAKTFIVIRVRIKFNVLALFHIYILVSNRTDYRRMHAARICPASAFTALIWV